ncbi:MAG: Rho termination factor N-terminal domain-containing protein [Candidatus Methylomirabilales bacterium]
MEREEMEGMTVTKLRELALEKYPEIQGVSGMKKEDLIEAIIAEEVRLGLRPKEEGAVPRPQAGQALKARIRALKAERDRALAAKDGAGLRHARFHLKRLKRRLRSAASKGPSN